jgi:uncharacterized protein
MSKIDGESLHRALPTFASDIRALVGEDGKLPPVESWQPTRSGEIDIRIAADGVWYYQGEVMQRESVVRLLSRILRKDSDAYYLVTPSEKMKIDVDDAPFVVTMMDIEGEGCAQKIHFSTQTGDYFTLSAEHPLETIQSSGGEPKPYVKVRHDLLARINRSVYYELAEHVVPYEGSVSSGGVVPCEGDNFGVWSSGELFLLG